LISKEYINVNTNLKIQCKCGNIFKVTFSNFKNGNPPKHQCNTCGLNNRKHTYEEVKDYIEIKSNSGCKLLSTEYKDVHDKLKIQCKCGKIFYKKYHEILLGQCNCPECSYNKMRTEFSEVKKYIKSLGYKLLSENYINNKEKLVIKSKEGFITNISFNTLKTQTGISFFDNRNIYALENIKLWIKINRKPFKLLSKKYIHSKEILICKCLKPACMEKFKTTWNLIIKGHGCPFCRGSQVGVSNCLATKNPQLAKEWHSTKNGKLTPYDVTCHSNKKVWWQCSECKWEWRAVLDNRSNGSGCPNCKKSFGEIRINHWLDYENIIYNIQKEYDGLLGIGNGNLSYDFYLPDHNLLIEYQGEQHEHPVDFKGKGIEYADKQFIIQQEHDRRKKEYAINHNINLLEIWYWDFDNIEEILSSTLIGG